ncbi:MAG: hypothetical protein ACREEY_14450, partial [Brevundimonas sp.]
PWVSDTTVLVVPKSMPMVAGVADVMEKPAGRRAGVRRPLPAGVKGGRTMDRVAAAHGPLASAG